MVKHYKNGKARRLKPCKVFLLMCRRENCLVLSGPDGAGKTSFFVYLLPCYLLMKASDGGWF